MTYSTTSNNFANFELNLCGGTTISKKEQPKELYTIFDLYTFSAKKIVAIIRDVSGNRFENWSDNEIASEVYRRFDYIEESFDEFDRLERERTFFRFFLGLRKFDSERLYFVSTI